MSHLTDLKNEIGTDRTKANSKKEKANLLETLERAKRYGIHLIIKRHDWGNSYEIYQIHTIKKGKPCQPELSYVTQGTTIEAVNNKIHAMVCLFQDKYIFEDPKVTNEKRLIWTLEDEK